MTCHRCKRYFETGGGWYLEDNWICDRCLNDLYNLRPRIRPSERIHKRASGRQNTTNYIEVSSPARRI
jgi:hypothetical protein